MRPRTASATRCANEAAGSTWHPLAVAGHDRAGRGYGSRADDGGVQRDPPPFPRRQRYGPCTCACSGRARDGPGHNGRLSVREAPDDDAIDGQIWIFDTRGRIEAPPSASKALDQAASRLAGGASRTVDAHDTRLYATPIVTHGVRTGTLVAGVGLRAYHQTARTSLLGSIAFALLLFGLVLMASRWLLRHSLQPVAEMTRAATDWSEHEPDRRFARGEPHDELTSLAATLDNLLERLALSLHREQRFSAEMSHELRTPLARVQAEVELALARERTPAEHREALAAIGRSAEQMTRTVDALVAAARTASSPYAAPPMREKQSPARSRRHERRAATR